MHVMFTPINITMNCVFIVFIRRWCILILICYWKSVRMAAKILNCAYIELRTRWYWYDRGLSSLLYDQLHWLNVPERIEYKLAVMIRRCLEDKAPKYLSDYCIPVTAVSSRHLYVQSTSINWLYRAVGELHSAIGLSLLQARWYGTHYRLSFAICLSVLVFFGALLRRQYSRDISASSAIEMYPLRYKFPISIYLSIIYLSKCEAIHRAYVCIMYRI